MRIGLGIDYTDDIVSQLDRIPDLEGRGLDMVWMPEPYGVDAISQMAYLAGITTDVELAAGVANVFARTPAMLAQTAATLDILSKGRCVLGVGASGPQVVEGWHGVPYRRPLARTRDTIEICRQVWRREPLDYVGSQVEVPLRRDGTLTAPPIRLLAHPVRDRIPIWVAALGDKNVEMTAECAEGWHPAYVWPEKLNATWGESLRRGYARRELDEPLEIIAGGMVAIGDDATVAPWRERARKQLAWAIGAMGSADVNFYAEVIRRYGMGRQVEEVQTKFRSGDRDGAIAAVPAELIDNTALCGDEATVRRRLEAYAEAGVTVFKVSAASADLPSTIETLKSWAT